MAGGLDSRCQIFLPGPMAAEALSLSSSAACPRTSVSSLVSLGTLVLHPPPPGFSLRTEVKLLEMDWIEFSFR